MTHASTSNSTSTSTSTSDELTTKQLADIKDFVYPLATDLGRWAREQSDAHYGGLPGVEVSTKTSPGDFVTSVDLAVQERLVTALEAAFPDYGFLGEEAGLNDFDQTQPVWVIDPIDGTHNFVRNYPGFCVSVGLVHGGKSVLGVIFDSATDTTYWAYRGGGAWQRERRLQVSAKTELRTAMITTGFTRESAINDEQMEVFKALNGSVAGCRVSGSACRDLTFGASGKIDLFWQHGIRPWDVAAGLVMVEEAGGKVHLELNGPDLLRSGPLVIFTGAPAIVDQALKVRADATRPS